MDAMIVALFRARNSTYFIQTSNALIARVYYLQYIVVDASTDGT